MIDFLINIPFPYEVFIEMSSAILIPRTMEFYIYIKVKEKEIFKKFQNLNWQGWRQLAFRPNISLLSIFNFHIMRDIHLLFEF